MSGRSGPDRERAPDVTVPTVKGRGTLSRFGSWTALCRLVNVPSRRARWLAGAIATATLAGALALGVPVSAIAKGGPTVEIQFLDVSDWHAQLDPVNVNGVDIGGAAVLSSYFKADRIGHPDTITLTAGDDFGATPPLSGFFNEVRRSASSAWWGSRSARSATTTSTAGSVTSSR